MAESVVSFHLIHSNAGELGCPQATSDVLNRVSSSGLPLNNDADRFSWRVTFDRSSTTQTPTCLLVFGSHPTCTIVLNGPNISPIHCRIYAQLNSGHQMMVIEDYSGSGTSFFDDGPARAGRRIRIMQDRLYAENLRTLKIGPYQFRIELPVLEAEKKELGRWFSEHEPQPVSEPMLRAQLMGKTPDFQELGQVGEGGNGMIYRVVEKRTGLLFAIKKQPESLNINAHKDIIWMKKLRSEAVSFVHEKGALHEDVKPDNFFLLKKRPIEVVLGDFGHTVSTQDHRLLVGDCGTEGYAAPERFSQRHTAALDIYSLGVSFFVMVEFERLRRTGWRKRMADVAQQPLRVYGGLIKRMVATDPKERPSIQACMAAIRGRQYDWGNPAQILWQPVQKVSPYRGYNQQLPAQVPPIVAAKCIKKRHAQPGKTTTYNNLFLRLGKNIRTRTPTPVVNAPPINTDLFKRRLGQSEKTTTNHNIFADHGTKAGTALSKPATNLREHEGNATTRRSIFANDDLKASTTHPTQAAKVRERKGNATTHRSIFSNHDLKPSTAHPVQTANIQEHRGNATTHHKIFAHLDTNTTTPPPMPITDWGGQGENVLFGRQAQQPQPSNRITRPKPPQRRRIGTRDHLRRSPIRHANITRAFAIGKRVTRICDTTTNMAKCLYYLGAGVVTNTRDIALLGVDTFRLFKDVGRARQVIKHMQPEASIQLGDATRLAAGMKSRELRFVTPAEYEEERMRSVQCERLGTGSEDELD